MQAQTHRHTGIAYFDPSIPPCSSLCFLKQPWRCEGVGGLSKSKPNLPTAHHTAKARRRPRLCWSAIRTRLYRMKADAMRVLSISRPSTNYNRLMDLPTNRFVTTCIHIQAGGSQSNRIESNRGVAVCSQRQKRKREQASSNMHRRTIRI